MEHDPSYCKFCGSELSTTEREGKMRFYCESCDRVLWQDRTPSVAVLIEEWDKVLVIKRGLEPWKGKWSIPAGFMELDEEPEESAVRELKEESGIEADPGDLEPFANLSIDHPDGKQVVLMVYTTDNYSGEIETGDEVKEAGFRTTEDLEKTPPFERILSLRENE